MSKKIINEVSDYLMPILTELELELFDIEFVKEGPDWYLRVFIDKQEGIQIQDCESVSKLLGKILDEKDPIEQSYILEVSSPGIERKLTKPQHYVKYLGSPVKINLYKPVNGTKKLNGTLVEFKDDVVTLEKNENLLQFNLNEIADCRIDSTL